MKYFASLACFMCLLVSACAPGSLTGELDIEQETIEMADLGVSEDYASKGKGKAKGKDKVTICHVPPGNPDAAHLITVGAPALEHHLANHPGDVHIMPTIPNPIPNRRPMGGCQNMMMGGGPGD